MNAIERQPHSQLAAIESLRGVAALMVLFYHYAELMQAPMPDLLGFIRTDFGRGVPLFYTLSGFVLAYGYADRLWRGEGVERQVLVFYLRRLFRIAPLFYFMLAVWLLADKLIWQKSFPMQTLLLNFSFLFGLVPGQHISIVWAGWSIGIEMLFYLLFPIIALLLRNLPSTLVGLALSCVLSAAVFNAFSVAKMDSYAYMNLATHLPFFIAGMLCQRIWRDIGGLRRARLGWCLFGLALALAVLLVSGQAYWLLVKFSLFAADRTAWCLVFGLLVLSSCLASIPFLERGLLRHLGRLSFSLYLLHPFVMMLLIQAHFVEWLAALPVPAAWAFAIGAACTLTAVWATSSLSFRYVEAPGIALGRRVAGRVLARAQIAQVLA